MARGEETAAQKLRNQIILGVILLVCVGLPSLALAMGTFRWISNAWVEVNFAHWGIWVALGFTSLVYAVVIMAILVQLVLAFMVALKR